MFGSAVDGALVSCSVMDNAARTLGLKARKRERVRCSSLVDWPVYPRLAHTMRASNGAQCIEVTPQGWADRGAGVPPAPSGGARKKGTGREGASENRGDGIWLGS
jgi:hypothetical protein